jgi:hypothetical protein
MHFHYQEKPHILEQQMKKAFSLLAICIVAMLVSFSIAFAGSATLHWQANTESDLAGYRVYYGTSSRSYGPPVPVGNVTSYRIDNLKPGSTYYFAVTATDSFGNESGYSQEVQKTIQDNIPLQSLEIQLDKGWNLISLHLQPTNTSTENIVSSISNQLISIYSFENNSWKLYSPQDPGLTSLSTLVAGKGYYVDMENPGTLLVSGSETGKTVSLTKGWNLVGYNANTSQPIERALSSIAGKFVSVWAYGNSKWELYDPSKIGFNNLTQMKPGRGYWIYATEACTWSLP